MSSEQREGSSVAGRQGGRLGSKEGARRVPELILSKLSSIQRFAPLLSSTTSRQQCPLQGELPACPVGALSIPLLAVRRGPALPTCCPTLEDEKQKLKEGG